MAGPLYELGLLRKTDQGLVWDNIYFRIGRSGNPEIVSHIPNSSYVVYIPEIGSQQPLKSKLTKLTETEAKKVLDNLSKDFGH